MRPLTKPKVDVLRASTAQWHGRLTMLDDLGRIEAIVSVYGGVIESGGSHYANGIHMALFTLRLDDIDQPDLDTQINLLIQREASNAR